MQNQVRRERIKTYLNKWKTNSYNESIEKEAKMVIKILLLSQYWINEPSIDILQRKVFVNYKDVVYMQVYMRLLSYQQNILFENICKPI